MRLLYVFEQRQVDDNINAYEWNLITCEKSKYVCVCVFLYVIVCVCVCVCVWVCVCVCLLIL